MKEKVININEVDVTGNPVVYTCHGLGSCVALFLTDRLKNLTAGAHISFSSSASHRQDVFKLINQSLGVLACLGSDLMNLRAKLAGGAKVFDSSFNIGEENSNTVVECLVEKRIFIAATDVGGHLARTVRFNSVTRELKISTSDQRIYSI